MEKRKIGILGTGRIAGLMAATVQKMDQAEIYAVASREKDRAQEFAAAYEIPKAYGSYEELIEEKEVDLIYIATPHSHHYEEVKRCLINGCPVLCEKSFTANQAQAQELVSLAKENQVFLMEAMWIRFFPLVGTIQRILNGGVLGRLSALTANTGYAMADKKRIVTPELAGGALLDVGVYPLHFAAMFFGWDIRSISSDVVMFGTGVDAQESITIKYQDGRMAQLYATALANTDLRGVIYGEQGRLEIDNINNFEAVRLYDKNGRLLLTERAPEQISGYEYEVEECIRVLSEGGIESPVLPFSETLRIMQQMDTIRNGWGMKFPFEK